MMVTKGFRCEHAFIAANQVKIGGGRVGCGVCRRARHLQRAVKSRRDAADDGYSFASTNTPAPLRRFSWEP